MAKHYDVIVAGLGSLGSAAAYHLARRGRRVLGVDRFTPPHTAGSHHGNTRIIREAYFEDPRYVPMVQQAYEEWRALESACGTRLLSTTGGLMIGVPGGLVVAGARRSAEEHDLPHESLTVEEVHRRHPGLRLEEGMQALYEPRAGVLFSEECVRAHLDGARAAGAQLRFDEPITAWSADATGVRIETPRSSWAAERLLLCAGAWMAHWVPQLAGFLEVERQVIYWFEPAEPHPFEPGRLPIFLIEHERDRYYYGFPDFGAGVKVAIHHEGEIVAPEQVRREVGKDEIVAMRGLNRRFLPALDGRLRNAAVCLYTNTGDRNFILDFHPEHPNVVVASPCSGHGFKFCGVLGGAAASLIEGGAPAFDLSMFAFR